MEEKRAYRIIVNGCDEIFNKDCLQEEAEAQLYAAIKERKYEWLELRRGQADEEDEVVDCAWSVGQINDGRYIYEHETLQDLVKSL